MLPAGVESFSGPISVTAFEISCSAGSLRQIPFPGKDTAYRTQPTGHSLRRRCPQSQAALRSFRQNQVPDHFAAQASNRNLPAELSQLRFGLSVRRQHPVQCPIRVPDLRLGADTEFFVVRHACTTAARPASPMPYPPQKSPAGQSSSLSSAASCCPAHRAHHWATKEYPATCGP